MVATANQRPVSAAYPYYIGTAPTSSTPGTAPPRSTDAGVRGVADTASFGSLQTGLTDRLAVRWCPSCWPRWLGKIKVFLLKNSCAPPAEHLERHDGGRLPGCRGLVDVLGGLPRGRLPALVDREGPGARGQRRPGHHPDQDSLDEDAEAWTLQRPGQPGLHPARLASGGMRLVSCARPSVPPSRAWRRRSAATRQLDLGSAALPGVPGAQRHQRPWLRAEGGGRRRVHRGRRQRRDQRDDRAELADDRDPARRQASPRGASTPAGRARTRSSPWYDEPGAAGGTGQYLPIPAPGRPAGSLEWRLNNG